MLRVRPIPAVTTWLVFVPCALGGLAAQPDPATGLGAAMPSSAAAECDSISWPADYVPTESAVQPPSVALGLRGAVSFPEHRLVAVDSQALLAEDAETPDFEYPLRVGINRPLTQPVIGEWTVAPGRGALWTAAIRAEGALSLRLHLTDVDLPPGAAIYLYSPADPDRVVGPYVDTGPHHAGAFWAGSVFGDTAHVEYYDPHSDAAIVPFRIDELGHMYRDVAGSGGLRAWNSCMEDVACYDAWEDVSYAVAKITMYVGGNWASCSGTLLASQNGDLTPYFLTSAHCLDTQFEADTIEFRWFYQRATCDGPFMTTQTSEDADLLATSGSGSGADWTLLMAKGALPAGVSWSGWTAAAQSSGSWSVTVHHAGGDEKRYSRGRRYGYSTYYDLIDFDVTDAVGTIYFGTSGSGIWRESDQKLFGNASWISGPGAGCDYLETIAGYGRFSRYYSTISTWLAAGSDDALEDNDACESTPLLGSGAYSDLVIKSVDEDWYRISLRSGAQLSIALTFIDSYGNIDAQLFDACGGSLVASGTSTTNNELLTYVNPGPLAEYFLRVYLSDDTRNSYEMVISGAYVDCNDTQVDDPCDISCTSPGCAGQPGCGLSLDCNANFKPDECELAGNDCDANSTPDDCDMDAMIAAHPVSLDLCDGDDAEFSVGADGGTPMYQWQRYVEAVWQDVIDVPGEVSGAATDTLTLSSVQAVQDAGQYRCLIIEGCLVAPTDPATLTITVPPSVTSEPPDVQACEQSNAGFTATFQGTVLAFQWELSTNGPEDGPWWQEIPGEFADQIIMTSVTASDEGWYRCRAANLCSVVYTDPVFLDIGPIPTIVEQPHSTCAEVGGRAIFQVTALTQEGDVYDFDYEWSHNFAVIPGVVYSTLILDSVSSADAGNYYVKVSSSPECRQFGSLVSLQVGGCGPCYVPGDMDDDADVDLADFALFQTCSGLPATGDCQCADLNSDTTVDMTDFVLWSNEMAAGGAL